MTIEKCYEYFGCAKTDCVAMEDCNKDRVDCWNIPDTQCNGMMQEKARELGISKCGHCLYFSEMHHKFKAKVR